MWLITLIFHKNFKNNKNELKKLNQAMFQVKSYNIENKELKELFNDYVSSSNKILAKIIVDHNSPF